MRSKLLSSLLLLPFLALAQSKTNVYFASGSYELSQASKHTLDSLAGWLVNNPAEQIQVKGYTDTVGTRDYNQKLSENRAAAVAAYLVQKKVPQQIIVSTALSERSNGNNLAVNRCVEISVAFALKAPVITEEIVEPLKTPERKVAPPLTVYKGTNGTLVKVPKGGFGSVPNENVNVTIQEFFRPDLCIDCGMTTVTTSGQCLRTGGMVFLNATYQGKKIDSLTGDFLAEVWIPTDNFDSSMALYTAVRMPDGTIAWQPAQAKLRLGNDGKDYYVFETRALSGGFNCDAPIPDNAFCSGTDTSYISTGRFRDGVTYLSYANPKSIFRAKNISPNLTTVNHIVEKSGPTVTSTAYKHGNKYRAQVPVSKLKVKEKNGKKILKIRRKYYKKVKDGTPDGYNCPDF